MALAARIGICTLAVAAALGWSAGSADAYLYWGGAGADGNVGRATLTGEGPEPGFILSAAGACGVAVDFEYVYWVNGTDVGRAEIDGDNPDPDFIDNVSAFCGVAVNATHVYWTASGGDIRRADRDGTNVTTVVDGTAPNACGLALDSTYIYWGQASTPLSIGRAELDGANANASFIPNAGSTNGCGPAVNSTHVFWANPGDLAIGRANLDGTAPDSTWLDVGPGTVANTAVDATHLYWAIQSDGTIHRADLDGTDPVQLLDTPGVGNGLALDTGAPPAPACPDENLATAFETPLGIDLDCAGLYTITYEIVSPPTHGNLTGFDASTGAVTYTPDAGFDGADSFTYRASNAGGPSAPATATVAVAPPPPDCPTVALGLERWKPSPPFGRRRKAPGLRARLTTSVPASVLFDTTILFGKNKLPLRRRTLDVPGELVIRALLRGKALRELSPGDPARLRIAARARPLSPETCPRQDRVELTVSTRVKRVAKRKAMARSLAARIAAF